MTLVNNVQTHLTNKLNLSFYYGDQNPFFINSIIVKGFYEI